MRIKIVGCRDTQMWYKNHIGLVCGVIGEDSKDYVVRQPEGYTNIVKKSDAEVINDGNIPRAT